MKEARHNAAAAAKSLESCPTLCDPMDCSLQGSLVYGIFQARILEWVAIAFSWLLQFSLVAQSCPAFCDPMNRRTPGLPVNHQLPEFTQTHVHRVSDAIQPSHPLWSPSPPAWSFSFSIIPSKEIPGLISFRMDWLDLLAVQGTLKSLLHSSKASILLRSAFFTVQLSHPYMTTGKTIALTRWALVNKVMSLLLNMLSTLIITFLPRSKCLLI